MDDDFDENVVHHELYTNLLWSTKNQQPILSPIAQPLYHYACEVALSCDCNVVDGNVFNDHIQLIVKFSPETSFSNMITTFKVATSMWIRTYFPEIKNFEWQQSDFAFSVSSEHACCTIDTKTIAKFPEKIRLILDENELEYDPEEILE